MSAIGEAPRRIASRLSSPAATGYPVATEQWSFRVENRAIEMRGRQEAVVGVAPAGTGNAARVVARISQLGLALIGLTGAFAAIWRAGVPLGLSLVLIVNGSAELVAFAAGQPRRITPAIATGFVVVGVLGLLLLAVSLVA